MGISHDIKTVIVGEAESERLRIDDRRLTVVGSGPDDPAVTDDCDCVVVDEATARLRPTDVVRKVRDAGVPVPVVAVQLGDADDTPEAVVFDDETGVDVVTVEGPSGEESAGQATADDHHDGEGYSDVASLVCDVAGTEPTQSNRTIEGETGGDRAREAAEGYREKLRALHGVAVDLVACETDREAFERAVDAAGELLDFLDSLIYVREGEALVPTVAAESSSLAREEASTFDLDQGAMGHTYRTGESVLVRDTAEHDIASPTSPEIRSGMTVALDDIGVFNAISDEPGAFDEEDLALAEILAAHLTTAVQRIRSESETRRERNRFRALFNNVPDAAVLLERDDAGRLRIESANPAFERTLADEGDAVAGTQFASYLTDSDGESPTDFTDGEGVTVEPVRLETPEGIRDFLFRGFPIDASEGRQYYAIFTDVTERLARKRELEEKTQRLEEFASIVSHDLRNPLQVAYGQVGLLRRATTGAEVEHVDSLADALERMETLIDDLLTVAHEGWSVESRESADGERVVEEAWDLVETHDATLECEWTATVWADEKRLKQTFENLFRNAVEHAGPDVTVRVEPLDDCEGEGVAVADDGPGLPPDKRDAVFERGVSDGDGTGLGLSIVERIVDAHGWRIRATESEDGGARFEIRFGTGEESSE